MLLETFLELHGFALHASDGELLTAIVDVASGSMSEDAFTAWVRGHAKERPD